jgi:cell division protein FtsW
MFIGMGLAAATLVFAVPMKTWESTGPLLLALAVLLLVLVLIPGIGVVRNGARRWIPIGPFLLQVSEPARLAVIVYLAGYIVRRQLALRSSIKGLFAPFILLAPIGALLIGERDFGATAILMLVALLMLFIGGARLRDLALIGATVGTVLVMLVLITPYRVKRVVSFLNPELNPRGDNFQLMQSLIAVARGEWNGVGLGNSLQKLLYLPEMHTDFIFAILAEEFGLFGVLVLIGLFATVVWRGFAIGRVAESLNARFSAYLCYGLSGWFGLQSLINMGVNMGALPTKGLTLPFMSYGGSSLITVCVMAALILRVDYENRYLQAGHPGIGGRTGAPDALARRAGRAEAGTSLFAFFRRRSGDRK